MKPADVPPAGSPNAPKSPAPAQVSLGCCAMPRRTAQLLGVLLAAAACLAGGWMFLRDPEPAPDRGGAAAGPASDFPNWPQGKPQVALILSGQNDGYLQQCGCSYPQYGGLTRRSNLIQGLKDKGWPVVAFDVGDFAPPKGLHEQKLKKYVTFMRAFRHMGYAAVGVGANEFQMPLFEALANYSLENPAPAVLAANLLDPNKDFADLVKAVEVAAPAGGPRVAALGLVGRSVEKKVTGQGYRFADNGSVLRQNLQALKGKADLVVLLYQGTMQEARLAAGYCAGLARQGLPAVNVLVCLTEFPEPPATPERTREAPDTLIVALGNKGKYVGVVGAFPGTGAGPRYRLEYHLALMAPELDTPTGKEKGHPVMEIMEQYAREVRDADLLSKTPRSKHNVQVAFPQAKYLGSERCGDCHQHAYRVWEKSGHGHAFEALTENARHPSLRQFDPECVTCHTVGFTHPGGYADPANKPRQNLKLLHVGCESCHGPGSVHVDNLANKEIQAKILPLMNPWKHQAAAANLRLKKIDFFCMNCHDEENDVHWTKVPFQQKWQKVEHASPPEELQRLRGMVGGPQVGARE